jgi:hypothetical protein
MTAQINFKAQGLYVLCFGQTFLLALQPQSLQLATFFRAH